MPISATRVLITAGAALASACSGPEPVTSAPEANPILDAAAANGTRYTMYSVVGIGDIVLTPDALVTSDGQRLPVQAVGEGIWTFPEPPSRLSNGEDFCFSTPVTYFTMHLHQDGLVVMNVGDWRAPPAVPDSDTWQADGGCGLFTYVPPGA